MPLRGECQYQTKIRVHFKNRHHVNVGIVNSVSHNRPVQEIVSIEPFSRYCKFYVPDGQFSVWLNLFYCVLGAISDTNIIKSLQSKLAVFLPKDSGMGERSVIDPAANALTQRYNSIISASSMTASKSPCGGESHSSWVDRKSKVGRRYKYSQLDWYRIKGACNRKRDSANGRYSCTSPERTPQGRGLKQHVQTDSGYVSRDACPYYACDEARSSATVTATTANGYCTPVSQVTTMPFIPMGTSTFGEMARPFTSSSLPMPTSRVHSCSVCAEEFSSYDLLSSHISTHVQAASQPVVRCPFCGDGFKDPIAFFDHTANHVDHNPFQTEFGTDKQEIIRKQSTESVRMSEERDPISIARWGEGLPTSGRSPFKYDTEIQSERTELQEQEMTERRHTLTRNETHYHYDGNTAVSDASADSGVSSPVAPTVTQSVVSPPVSFSVAPLTPSHSVTKTHFCFTGSAAGAMSSVEPSYGYPFASSTATTPVESIGTGNATPSTSSSVEFPTPSHDAEAIEESSPSFQAEDSPATEGCMNGTAVDGNPQHAVTPESDTQEAQQSLGIQTPYACDILSVSEEASSPQESLPGRRRKRLCSTLSDTAVSDVQSDDLDICQIKYVPSRRRRGLFRFSVIGLFQSFACHSVFVLRDSLYS